MMLDHYQQTKRHAGELQPQEAGLLLERASVMPELPQQVLATDLAIHLIRVLREKTWLAHVSPHRGAAVTAAPQPVLSAAASSSPHGRRGTV